MTKKRESVEGKMPVLAVSGARAWAEENPYRRPTSEDDRLVCWTFVDLAWRLVKRPERMQVAGRGMAGSMVHRRRLGNELIAA